MGCFFLQKFRFYLRFSVVGVLSFRSFRGSYGRVRIALSVAFADGFMPRKVLDVRKECVRLSCQRQTKSPFGAVGWRFPCQPFSVCRKQKGFSDERGNLFFEIGKVIDAKHPSIVFLENVANLTENDHGKTFNVIHNELAGRGYFIRYLIADACDYGIPQHRTRTYIVAFSDRTACEKFTFPEKVPLEKRITDIIDVTVKADDKYYYSPDTAKYKRLSRCITDEKQLYRFADYGIQSSKDGISFTLKANMGTYYDRVPIIKNNFDIRNITPTECLALQGFPKNSSFSLDVPEREQYKQAGNTVCVEVVEILVKQCI